MPEKIATHLIIAPKDHHATLAAADGRRRFRFEHDASPDDTEHEVYVDFVVRSGLLGAAADTYEADDEAHP